MYARACSSVAVIRPRSERYIPCAQGDGCCDSVSVGGCQPAPTQPRLAITKEDRFNLSKATVARPSAVHPTIMVPSSDHAKCLLQMSRRGLKSRTKSPVTGSRPATRSSLVSLQREQAIQRFSSSPSPPDGVTERSFRFGAEAARAGGRSWERRLPAGKMPALPGSPSIKRSVTPSAKPPECLRDDVLDLHWRADDVLRSQAVAATVAALLCHALAESLRDVTTHAGASSGETS